MIHMVILQISKKVTIWRPGLLDSWSLEWILRLCASVINSNCSITYNERFGEWKFESCDSRIFKENNLYDGNATSSQDQEVLEVGVGTKATRNDIEGRVGKYPNGSKSYKQVAQYRLFFTVKLELLNSAKKPKGFLKVLVCPVN